MLECLILGDSIAVGVSQIRKECVAYAEGGINSANWNKKFQTKELDAETVVISLGTNDLANLNTIAQLDSLRRKITAKRVFWIVPKIKIDKQEAVKAVAQSYEDIIITIPGTSPDGVHPSYRGYQEIGRMTK